MTSINKENWEALRGLTQDRSVVIMNAEKGFYMVVWCRDDYIKELHKQLGKTMYNNVNFKETILLDFIDKNNNR